MHHINLISVLRHYTGYLAAHVRRRPCLSKLDYVTMINQPSLILCLVGLQAYSLSDSLMANCSSAHDNVYPTWGGATTLS